MLSRLLRAALLCCAMSGLALAQSGGIPPEWEVQKQMAALAEHVQRVDPVLEQLKPDDWVKQGAPAEYTEQIKRTRSEIGYLIGSTKELAAHSERLTIALETYFRMQSADAMLRSVAAGVRKYQNPALADLLQSLIADTSSDREKLRQYVVDLAADREQQFRVADQEAQRCRAVLSKQPRPAVKTEKEERR